MNIRTCGGVLVFLFLTSCSQKNISGSYMASNYQSAVLLQLTETKDKQIMGNMISAWLQPDGQLQREEASITKGSIDANGHTILLTIGEDGLFGPSRNVVGEISSDGINLNFPKGTLHFASTKPEDFNNAVNKLATTGNRQIQFKVDAKQRADDSNHIAALAQELSAYNTRVLGFQDNTGVMRKQQEQLLNAAKKDLEAMHNFESKGQDFPANQARFRIGQLAFQMGQLKFEIDQNFNLGKSHLSEFDKRIANNPCNINANLTGCDVLNKEKLRYTTARSKVESYITQTSHDIAQNESAINEVNKQAGN